MFRIEVDVLSNIIYLYLSGEFNTALGENLVSLFTQELNKLKPGFKLLTDLSNMESMDLEAHRSIDIIMDISNQKQVAKVARVLTDKNRDIGFNIMSLFHYSKNVDIQTCVSIEEAKMYLNEKECQEGINGVT